MVIVAPSNQWPWPSHYEPLQNTSTKHNKHVVNQKLEYFDDHNVRERFAKIGVGFFLFVLLFFLTKYDCFSQKKCVSTYHLPFSLEWGLVVKSVEKYKQMI